MSDCQLLVLGGGPGGYAAAFHAADHGIKTVLVDADPVPGGVCLHRGCIPSKALLHIAKLLQETREAKQWGLEFAEPRINLDTVRQWKMNVVGKLTGGVSGLCKSRGVTLYHARGTFIDSQTLALVPGKGSENENTPNRIRFENAIIATGSLPNMPPMFAVNDPRVMDSTGALELPDVPKRLLVIGGGYIGLELGSVYAALGSVVSVVEFTEGLLPGCDRDLVKPLQGRLEHIFSKIMLKTKVTGLRPFPEGVRADLEGPEGKTSELFDRVLVAVGRWPNSKGIGLENTKVELDGKGFIRINRKQQTSDPRLLAIGDVAGEPMLAHKASREGKVAVEALLGQPSEFDNVAVPAVVFTDPEIAWCGVTENQAREQNMNVKIRRFPWAASGRAQTIGRTEGMTKLLFDAESERVVGMGIVGSGAGELIAEGVLAVETAAVARDVAESIHPHPTLSETVMESSEAVIGNATHIFRPNKS